VRYGERGVSCPPGEGTTEHRACRVVAGKRLRGPVLQDSGQKTPVFPPIKAGDPMGYLPGASDVPVEGQSETLSMKTARREAPRPGRGASTPKGVRSFRVELGREPGWFVALTPPPLV
jgi:hypothetical protein